MSIGKKVLNRANLGEGKSYMKENPAQEKSVTGQKCPGMKLA